MSHRSSTNFLRMVFVTVLGAAGIAAQAQPASAPRASGTVKSTAAGSLVISGKDGQDVTVTVPDTAQVLEVAPGSTSLQSATKGALADVVAGDQVLVTGTAGDAATTLTARRVVVMKAAAIAASKAALEEAWQRGGGGIVKSVDAPAKTIVVVNGASTLNVHTTAATVFRRYAGDSVRFSDAVRSSFAQVQPGDQLRVRGTRSGDGSTITADEIVTGSFQNLSGLLTAVNVPGGTVTLKDLATKASVTVNISSQSDLRRLPPQAAARLAARAGGQGVSSEGTTPGSTGAAASGPGGSMRAGYDLSQMLSRLPTETLGGLKPGDAVMIVANAPTPGDDTAITLLVGVDPILRAAPQGEMTLTPWAVGGDASGGGGGQ